MDLKAIAKQAAAERLERPVVELSAEEKTDLYPWFDQHRVVWITDAQRYLHTCVVTAAGEGLVFAEPWGLERLNQLFGDEGLDLPRGLAVNDLARCLRDLLRGPGGFVGTGADLSRERQGLTCWIRPEHDFDSDKALFERCFRDPVLDRAGADWSLDFFYFTREGGVEHWKIGGDGGGLEKIEVKQTVADGRFRYPYM